MSNIRISVCIATRNGEKYLHRQLASILRQLSPEDEVVISDDSSTDGTVGIIRDFDDSRIRLLENNTFYSPIYNFENAIKHASGEIVALADQDDIWLENKVKVISQHLADRIDRVALIMMDGYIVDGDGTRTGQTLFGRKRPKKGIGINLFDNTFTGCALAFTRPLLEMALPFPSGIPMHDSWLGLLALKFGEVDFLETKTMEYRRHGVNVSRWQRNPYIQFRWRIFLAYHLWQRSQKYRRENRA
ncbi:glycosyltransferase family 2 protein [Thermodesulfobacteriota bacterium]